MSNLKNQKWLRANKICMVRGDSVARNLMFENQKDHERFLRYWDKYLGKMTEVLHYRLSPTGWIVLFRTQHEENILKAYQELRQRSNKAADNNSLTDVGKILSEHIRIFLSQYVRRTNAEHGRSGTLVKQRFWKYVFHLSEDYRAIFEKITDQLMEPHQILEKYRADESQYDQLGELESDSVYALGTRYYRELEKMRDRVLKCMRLVRPDSSVLRKFLSPPKNPNSNPPFT